MEKTIGWERGLSIGRATTCSKAWMRTKSKKGFSSLLDYHRNALFFYGSNYEVKSYEWKNHYSVKARRIKD